MLIFVYNSCMFFLLNLHLWFGKSARYCGLFFGRNIKSVRVYIETILLIPTRWFFYFFFISNMTFPKKITYVQILHRLNIIWNSTTIMIMLMKISNFSTEITAVTRTSLTDGQTLGPNGSTHYISEFTLMF